MWAPENNASNTQKSAALMIACMWLLAFVVGWPPQANAQNLPSTDVTRCVYPMPEDPASVMASVAALAKGAGAPGEPDVNISFDKALATVSVSADGYSLSIQWRAEEGCKPPFITLSPLSQGAPKWAEDLHKTLPSEFPHRPIVVTYRSTYRPVSMGVAAGLPWLALFLSILVFMGRRELVPKTPVGTSRYWVWGTIALGSAYFLMRWGSGMITADEVSYLAIPGADASNMFSLQYYLGDAGLPSLVHRLFLIILVPWGELTALNAFHLFLYALYGLALYRMCSELLPHKVAAVIAVCCLCNPRTLLYFGEHRSYASFLTLSALGQLMMLRYIRTANLRFGLWMVLFVGLASLDNPLCVVVLAAFTTCVLMVPQWRHRLHPIRLLTATLLLSVALVPAVITTSVAEHGGYESATNWAIASCFYVGPLIFSGPKSEHFKPLRFSLLITWLLLMVPMALGLLPWNAQKIELFVLPLLLTGSAAAVIGWLGAGKMRAIVLVPAAIGTLVTYGGLLKLHNELPELNTPTIAAEIDSLHDTLSARQATSPIDVHWERQWKRVEYASYLVPIDPFVINYEGSLGLPSFYKLLTEKEFEQRCDKDEPFAVLVSPYSSPPTCSGCRLLAGTNDTWHAWECR
jgi:hypothetical protein